jgi:hypothetical protein
MALSRCLTAVLAAALSGSLLAAGSASAAPADLAAAVSSPTTAPKFTWTLADGENSDMLVLTEGNKAVDGALRGDTLIDRAFLKPEATSYQAKDPLFARVYYWQVASNSDGGDAFLSPITKLTITPQMDVRKVRVKNTPWALNPHGQSIRATVHCNVLGPLTASVVVSRGKKVAWRGTYDARGCMLKAGGAPQDLTYPGGYTPKGAKLTAKVTFKVKNLRVTETVKFRAL